MQFCKTTKKDAPEKGILFGLPRIKWEEIKPVEYGLNLDNYRVKPSF